MVDIRDDLRREVRRKFEAGYPRDNILFQTPRRALLYQNDTLAIDADLTRPQALIDTLGLLFSYTAPAYDQWERAVSEFQERVPELARGLVEIIERQRKTNQRFIRAFAAAGKRLAELHVNYEQQPEYYWHRIENRKAPLSYRVEKMKLSKDKTSIVYNESLTIAGIPPEAHEYRLGNRSALEWVIDQYQVSTDKRCGITNDPNRLDDPEYIVRLIGQVITVSLETVKIVKNLPPLETEQPAK